MSTHRKTIAIDMDGVIADTVVQFITWYERDYGIQLTKEAFHGKSERAALPEGVVDRFVHSPGFFRDVPVMEGAYEALIELSQRFDIYIVSAAMEFATSLRDKYEWLSDHFPFITWRNIIFCGDKSVIGTDYMIDDHARNLDTFRGTSIMFAAGHNVDIDRHTRVNTWKEAVQLLLSS